MSKTKRSRDGLRFKSAVKDVLSAAECYKPLSMTISDDIQKLKERYNVPGYYWQWAEGYRDARVDYWYRHNLVFCYEWNGGLVVSDWTNSSEDFKEFIRGGGRARGGHYWKDDNGQPIQNRPFFVEDEVPFDKL